MLVYVEIVHLYVSFLKCIFPFQGKERPAKTNLILAKLRAVLVSAESLISFSTKIEKTTHGPQFLDDIRKQRFILLPSV